MSDKYSEADRAAIMFLACSIKWTRLNPDVIERLEKFIDNGAGPVPMELIPYPEEVKVARRMYTLLKYIWNNQEEMEGALGKFDDIGEEEFLKLYREYRDERKNNRSR